MTKPEAAKDSHNRPPGAATGHSSGSGIIVQKYGGATLANPELVKQVATRIAELSKSGTKVVAAVSAMGKTTNQLLDLANQVSSQPNRRELDMLLTTGERVSMALVSMALHDLGCDAISFTGSQAGILTNDAHVNANIIDVKAHRVLEALQQNKVVVLAGFQGVSPETKEITTLGRGGTDTTAVAMAAFLKADRCEILKDVAGVFTADPKVIRQARPIKSLSYDQMLEMTFWGAKVLHYRSVELAKLKNVRLYIGPANTSLDQGTLVPHSPKEAKMFETTKVLGLNSHEQVLEIEIKTDLLSEALKTLNQFLDKNEIAVPQILFTESSNGITQIFLTGPSEIVEAITKHGKIASSSESIFVKNDNLCTVTATCTGVTTPEISQNIFQTLSKNKIAASRVQYSAMSVTIYIEKNRKELALQALHSLI